MNKYVASNNQSVLDVAIATSGSIEGVISLLKNNQGLTLESNLRGGVVLAHDNGGGAVANLLSSRSIIPATARQYDAPYFDGEFSDDFNADFI
jgi:hypothetical protein